VLRSFDGGELTAATQELNAFCEGRHPMWEGVKLRGYVADKPITVADVEKDTAALTSALRNCTGTVAVHDDTAIVLGMQQYDTGRLQVLFDCEAPGNVSIRDAQSGESMPFEALTATTHASVITIDSLQAMSENNYFIDALERLEFGLEREDARAPSTTFGLTEVMDD